MQNKKVLLTLLTLFCYFQTFQSNNLAAAATHQGIFNGKSNLAPSTLRKYVQYWNDDTNHLCPAGAFSIFNCDFGEKSGVALCMEKTNLTTIFTLQDNQQPIHPEKIVQIEQNSASFLRVTWIKTFQTKATIFIDSSPGDNATPVVIISRKGSPSNTKYCRKSSVYIGGAIVKKDGAEISVHFPFLRDQGLASARDETPDFPHP